MSSPQAAAVIVHWGDPAPTVRLAGALRKLPSVSTVVVVANDQEARPAVLDNSICWVAPERNLGFAGGFEFGVDFCPAAELLLLLNNDVEIDDGCIKKCLDSFSDSSVGVAAPLLFNAAGLQSGVGRITRPFFVNTYSEHPKSGSAMDADWVTGAVMFIRRSCYDESRFNLRYFLSWEDTDFCFRVRRRGWRVVMASDARAFHQGGSTIPGYGAYYHYTRNRIWFAREWGSTVEWLAVWFLVAITILPRVIAADLLKTRGFARSLSMFHALADGIKRMPGDDKVAAAEPRPAIWGAWK